MFINWRQRVGTVSDYSVFQESKRVIDEVTEQWRDYLNDEKTL